jgi:hypothetical protein
VNPVWSWLVCEPRSVCYHKKPCWKHSAWAACLMCGREDCSILEDGQTFCTIDCLYDYRERRDAEA